MNLESLKELFGLEKKGTTVYAFHGPSGTGKSFRAKLVAQQYGIKAIIDDGLLIHDDEILAGKSAKLESTYMGAVRAALFDDKEHRDSVARAIQKNKIKKILILGTSEKMVNKIAVRLQLPLPEKYIKIQEISTPEQMEEARRSRQIEGKHVIPVRAYEVKNQSYSKIFYDSIRVSTAKNKFVYKLLRSLFGKPSGTPSQNTKLFEKSLVRPAFSQAERKEVSHAVLAQMTMSFIGEFNAQVRIKKLTVKNEKNGYTFIMTVDVPLGKELTQISEDLKAFVIRMIEKKLRLRIEDVYIVIDKLLKSA
ncbi:MAG: ATP-binding protein [Treponema sp.]|nr:ATP-binding protein [Treponema sp.]